MADLLILVPSRRRRANVERLIQACQHTGATADFALIVSDGDPSYNKLELPGGWLLVNTAEQHLSGKLNHVAEWAAGNYAAVAFVSDDQVPVTAGWDRALLDAAAIDPGWSYPDIGGRADIPECVCISSKIVKALGWFANPALSHYWLDNCWADLGNATGRLRFLPDVHVEHRHYSRGLAEHDDTYAAAEAEGERDAHAYRLWREGGQRDADVVILRRLFAA